MPPAVSNLAKDLSAAAVALRAKYGPPAPLPLAAYASPLPPPAYDGRARAWRHYWLPDPSDLGDAYAPDTTDPLLALYGPTRLPTLAGVRQVMGDCDVLASLAACVMSCPWAITAALGYDGYGPTVALRCVQRDAWGNLPGEGVTLHLSWRLSKSKQPPTGGGLWARYLEKAWASAYGVAWAAGKPFAPGRNTLAALDDAGDMLPGLGVWVDYSGGTALFTAADLAAAVAAKKPVLVFTRDDAPSLVRGHAYAVKDAATLYNPWGSETPATYDTIKANAKLIRVGRPVLGV